MLSSSAFKFTGIQVVDEEPRLLIPSGGNGVVVVLRYWKNLAVLSRNYGVSVFCEFGPHLAIPNTERIAELSRLSYVDGKFFDLSVKRRKTNSEAPSHLLFILIVFCQRLLNELPLKILHRILECLLAVWRYRVITR